MVKFITIDKHLKVSITNAISDSAVCISTNTPRFRAPAVYVNGVITQQMVSGFRDVLGDIEAEKHKEKTGEDVAYCLVPPDPWLLAIMYVMWDGVIQGVAWDGVKLLASNALNGLKSKKLAPGEKANEKRGFAFAAYADIASLFRVFVKLETLKETRMPDEYRIPTIDNPPVKDNLGDGLVTPELDGLRKHKQTNSSGKNKAKRPAKQKTRSRSKKPKETKLNSGRKQKSKKRRNTG